MRANHQVVCFGEVLWDVLPTGELPGGAPMNVAYHLQKLGMYPALITKVGTDTHGERLIHLLREGRVTTDYIQEDPVHPTGLVKATIGDNNEVSYDIVFPVAWDFIAWEERLTALVGAAPYFVFGSLASRHQTSSATLYQLLEAANTKVLDINLRPPHYSQTEAEILLGKADLLKLNEHELGLIAGWYGQLTTEEEKMRLLQDRFQINTIVVTKGGEGALLLQNGHLYQHAGYSIKVADTIGSGDAFLAGFIHQTAAGAAPGEALQFANGLGAFIATKSGACPLYQLSEVEALIQSGKSAAV